ncbi:MAG: YtxH domain-containing protein, partial [Phycisphaerae bacterium]|nr:YtxH domain-containing protein [Phycisphaerae bacterium]NIX32171.1 hypothetical protein [Phycisphaerae bacterium]
MWWMINFLRGFVIGGILGASIVLLTTPKSGEEIKELFKKEFEAKKAELESQLINFKANENVPV